MGEAPFKIIDGDRSKNYPQKNEFRENDYCIFLNTKNVTTDGFDFTKLNFISKEKDELLRKGKLKKSDLVLTTRGTIGNIGYYNASIPFDNIRINSGMVIIRPNGIHSNFNYYLFKHLKRDFEMFITGSAQPQLPIKDLKEIFLLIPPLPEQKAIASILSSLDDKIDLLHRQNKTLETMAETIFRQWFIEEANDDWEEGRLGDICNISGGYAFKSKDFTDEGVPIVKIKNISNNQVDILEGQFVSENLAQKIDKKFRLYNGDIVMAMTGNVGRIGLICSSSYDFLLLNQRVAVLRSKYQALLWFLLNAVNLEKDILNMSNGAVQANISTTGIESVPIPKINIKKAQLFNKEIESIFQKIKTNTLQIQTLTQLRDTLLPKLMSGKVRVQYDNNDNNFQYS